MFYWEGDRGTHFTTTRFEVLQNTHGVIIEHSSLRFSKSTEMIEVGNMLLGSILRMNHSERDASLSISTKRLNERVVKHPRMFPSVVPLNVTLSLISLDFTLVCLLGQILRR